MSEANKAVGASGEYVGSHEPVDERFAAPPDLPSGWKYRHRRIFGFNIPWYASPKIQLLLVAFVCFMCPGMFNALGGMGGGGKTDATLADNMVSGTCLKLYISFPPFKKMVEINH